ncbi:MAG: hypothetical protein CME70_04445 [Halobacteriovorax sp.]|nr:hypothetical protein [Halobacteriovorax sp.]|tara:strand:+ start:21627 stop:22868 length:1242 start_codon:yes stop_codon:yes gene_type:complete
MAQYKKYDDSIKKMIIKSGNPNLFPELNIPRTTALYWIRSAKKRVRVGNLNFNKALEDKIERLEKELQEEKAKNLFVQELLANLTGVRDVYNLKQNREKIIDIIDKYRKWISLSALCRCMRIRSDKYYRFKVETKGCPKISFNKCKIMAPNQITFAEQKKVQEMVADPKLSHLSVKGLQYHGFRHENLYFGYDCWRKYAREFGRRPRKKRKRKRARLGIRASRPNEIWHIDVTYFRLREGRNAYVQVVMDNYSRKIINWKVSLKKGQAMTIKNLKGVIKESQPNFLMSDGGGENTGGQVRQLLVGKNITKMIARKDVIFSNSMVESFFSVLKNRFINKYQPITYGRLYKKVKRAVELFNNMPTSTLEGATPIEIYDENICQKKLKLELRVKREEWKYYRPKINKHCNSGKECG